MENSMAGDFDMIKAFNTVNDLRHAQGVQDAMNEIISICQSMRPHQDWRRLAALPFAREVEQKSGFMTHTLRGTPPTKDLKGAFFGIYYFESDIGEMIADFSFVGCYEFDQGATDDDWSGDLAYDPPSNYFNSQVMADICRIAYGDEGGLGNDADYPLCLAHGMFLARGAVRCARQAGLLKEVAVIAGFHDGDFINLGII